VEQELLTLPEHLSSPLVFSGVHVAQSLVFYVEFCRSLHMFFFFLSLCCLSFFDLRLLIAHLVSSNFSYRVHTVFFFLKLMLKFSSATFYWSVCTKTGQWAVMYKCIIGIDFASVSTIFCGLFELFGECAFICSFHSQLCSTYTTFMSLCILFNIFTLFINYLGPD